MEDSVRVLLLIMAAALMSVPACAQGMTGAGKRGQSEQAADQQRKKKNDAAAERAYQAGLEKIPEAPKADPWGNLRGAEPGKAAAKNK
jgi:hypothetical protein